MNPLWTQVEGQMWIIIYYIFSGCCCCCFFSSILVRSNREITYFSCLSLSKGKTTMENCNVTTSDQIHDIILCMSVCVFFPHKTAAKAHNVLNKQTKKKPTHAYTKFP